MIIDCKNDIPPNYQDYEVLVERTGERLSKGIFYADDEAGFYDRYTTWPLIFDPEDPDQLSWERVYACIKIVPRRDDGPKKAVVIEPPGGKSPTLMFVSPKLLSQRAVRNIQESARRAYDEGKSFVVEEMKVYQLIDGRWEPLP